MASRHGFEVAMWDGLLELRPEKFEVVIWPVGFEVATLF